MGKRISPQQIETARTAFRNGKSVVEACSIAGMSKSSFMKYLGKEIEMWTQERLEQNNRIAEIVPQSPSFNTDVSIETDDVIIDDGTVESLREPDDNQIMLATQQEQDRQAAEELDEQMSDEAFMSLLDYEFSQCGNFEEAKAAYYDYKPQAIINIMRVEYFRKVYEETLIRVTSKSDDEHNDAHEQTSNNTQKPYSDSLDIDIVNLDADTNEQYEASVSNSDIIEQYKRTYNCEIKIPRSENVNEWTSYRLKQHLVYWLARHKGLTNKPALALSEGDEAELDAWMAQI